MINNKTEMKMNTFIPTITITERTGTEKKIEFTTIKELNKALRKLVKELGCTRQRGFYGNYRTGTEIDTNC